MVKHWILLKRRKPEYNWRKRNGKKVESLFVNGKEINEVEEVVILVCMERLSKKGRNRELVCGVAYDDVWASLKSWEGVSERLFFMIAPQIPWINDKSKRGNEHGEVGSKTVKLQQEVDDDRRIHFFGFLDGAGGYIECGMGPDELGKNCIVWIDSGELVIVTPKKK